MRNAATALAGLHLALGMGVRFDPPWIAPSLAPSPDLAGLALVLIVAPGRFASRGVRLGASGLLLILASARLAEGIALGFLGRPLDPVGDLPHVGAVASMLGVTLPIWALGGIVLGGALAFLGERAVRALAEAAASASARTRAIAGAVAALALLSPVGSGAAAATRIALAPLLDRPPPLTEPALPPAPDLGGADVVIVFVESYGVAALDEPGLGPAFARLAEDAAAGGFGFLSAQIQSPTFGGGSWRAHASLLSGVWIDSEARYRSLVRSDRESLVRRFGAAGYRTVAYEPGISGFWPDGAWYGFEETRDRAGIGWDGPRIGWWGVPDQFTLYALHQQELARAARPVFAKVSLIMSHIPYWPVPPYVTPWSRFDEGTAFAGPIRSVAHDDWRDLEELSDRYAASLSYEMRILGGFLRDLASRRALVVVVGDHQPPKLSLHDSDAWAVPIHVFSQDGALLEPFRALGFERTLVPLAGSAWRMSDLPRDLSRLFPPR